MNRMMKSIKELLLSKPPPELAEDFRRDCTEKNLWRFQWMPYLCIFTQIGCYIIYLYIYPVAYPERAQLDERTFTMISGLYIMIHVLFAILFARAGREAERTKSLREARLALTGYLICYVLLESFETVIEVEISGNIYRFLATFFVAAFLPLIPRLYKALLLMGFAGFVEVGFVFLASRGYDTSNRFGEIVMVFLFTCLVLSNVVYTSSVKSYLLRQELVAANHKLQEMITRDPLTNITNRRGFDEYITRIWAECKRNGNALNALMIDIDHFKLFNDHYGHQKGDECLIAVARFLDGHFARSLDMVARYGGEEFVVLLPYTTRAGVEKLAESARQGVEDLGIPNEGAGPDARVTISVGVATAVPDRDDRYENFLKMADDALYEAKNAGRNRVSLGR